MEESLISKIESANILVVGAGGIGCELLKNLSGSGFKHGVFPLPSSKSPQTQDPFFPMTLLFSVLR